MLYRLVPANIRLAPHQQIWRSLFRRHAQPAALPAASAAAVRATRLLPWHLLLVQVLSDAESNRRFSHAVRRCLRNQCIRFVFHCPVIDCSNRRYVPLSAPSSSHDRGLRCAVDTSFRARSARPPTHSWFRAVCAFTTLAGSLRH